MELTEEMLDLIDKIYRYHKGDANIIRLASLCGIGVHKHFYKGVPLVDYCKQHNINYGCVMSRMSNKGNTIEEAVMHVKKVMQYKGMSLFEYCKKNNIDYYKVYYNLKHDLNCTIEQAILKEKGKR